MLKKSLVIVLHLLFWGTTAWFIIFTFAIEEKDIKIIDGTKTVTVIYNPDITWQLGCCIFLSALMAYASDRMSTKYGAANAKPFLYSLLSLALAFFLFVIIRNTIFIPRTPAISYPLAAGIFLFYFFATLTYIVSHLWRNTDLLRKQMEVEKKDAELSLLRSQLHPHFLFNVLNSLVAMVDHEKNPEMVKAIHDLSELLRYVVNESGNGRVPVYKEIQFIKNYAALQSLRFEANELNFNLNIQGDYTKFFCDPGVFIPFIENAFKYGVEPEKKSDIDVVFDFTRENKINFRITNPIYPLTKSYGGNGFGITWAKKRLNIAYPQRHTLKYGPEQGVYIVNLELITDESNPS